MAKLIAFYSRADENYFGGTKKYISEGKLEAYDFSGKTIHPFCTHEGSGLSETVGDIRKAAKGATVTKGLAVHGSGVDSTEAAISEWVRETGK